MDKTPWRPLKVYAFDPNRGKTLQNYMTIDVRDEPLARGPVGAQIAVVDYDATEDCYYEAVDLDSKEILKQNGLDPSESDPRFHQQMVYAVVRETMRMFEGALGRPVKWGFSHHARNKDSHLLKIYPHAMREANAFYSRERQGLLFGYFEAVEGDAGRNLPGQVVFTCLSHDIVAHETTHALVDGLREYFMEPTSLQTLAFHEAFADVIALLQHFSYEAALRDTIQRTSGMIQQQLMKPLQAPVNEDVRFQFELPESNPMVDLAKQFGEALGRRAALRSAIGSRPDPTLLPTIREPHECGAILVAAVFDAFFTSYVRRTRDLFVIADHGGQDLKPGYLHPVFVENLARIAASTARHFAKMCIRALDYCPPVDIQFGEFLRALITADSDIVADDRYEYRDALIEAFRLRGIFPEEVKSLSEDSLTWDPPAPRLARVVCEGLSFDVAQKHSRKHTADSARAIHRFARRNAAALGLDRSLEIGVHSFHAVQRVNPDGRRVNESVVEILQKRSVPLVKGERSRFLFRGGATLVFNEDGTLRYVIHKSVRSAKREKREREYRLENTEALAAFTYDTPRARSGPVNFAALHAGFPR